MTLTKRLEMIKLGFELFLRNPIWGIGLDNVRKVVTGILSEYKYLHNTYIELLATGGIPGFACFYGIYYRIIKRINNIRRTYGLSDDMKIAMVLLTGQLILDIFVVSYYSKIQYILFAYVLILLMNFDDCPKAIPRMNGID